MLIEISCDEFKSYGKPRPPIVFRKGLNTVLGDHSASNSIGKSTFLLIVDFAFGGSDYAKSDAVRHIGTHTIKFKFEFDGKQYYFSRDTLTPERVNICDESYNVVGEPITIKQFCEKLFDLYHVCLPSITFRDIVGRYFRVYGRDNLAERRPLLAAAREPDEKAITALLKLFGIFERFEELKALEKESIAKRDAFKEAQKYEFLPFGITTKKQFSENERRISAIREELASLTEQTDKKLSQDDLEQADVAADIKGKLAYARRQRSRLKSQLRMIEANMEQGVTLTEYDLTDLIRFFPQANTKSISQIELFHSQMQDVLAIEFEEECQRLTALIKSIETEIEALESNQRNLGVPAKLSKVFLDKYTELSGRIRVLEKQNESYTKLQDLKNETKSIAARLTDVQDQELRFLQSDINNHMAKLNDYIYDRTHKPPILDLKSVKSYVFETPDDTGTGTSYKSLVVLDLSVLELTPLPALAHDSIILKNIGDAPIERIMELYLQCEKQLFIALDKDDSYTDRTSSILNDTAVLRLSGEGNQLFGRSWNIMDA